MTRWFSVVALVCAATGYKVQSAQACSQPPSFDLQEDLTQGLTGIPISGVVPIYASVFEDGQTIQPTMTVRAPSGAEVAGTLELGTWQVIWRSDAPLTPTTTYNATLTADVIQQVDFTFTTAANNDTPALLIQPGDLHLSEFHRPDEQICCNSGKSSCGDPWQECWTRAVTTEVELSGRFSVASEAARYYRFEGEAQGARQVSTTAHAREDGRFAAHFVDRSSEYCLTIRARSLVGGADVTQTICQSDAALVELAPFEPDPTDYGVCDDPPFNLETGEEIDTGGCNTGSGGATPLLAILIALGLLYRRRRTLAPTTLKLR